MTLPKMIVDAEISIALAETNHFMRIINCP